MSNRTKVVVLYGGQSTEHEVSCRSAAFIVKNLDRSKYDLFHIGIDKEGVWWPQERSALDKFDKESLAINKDISWMQKGSEEEMVASALLPDVGNVLNSAKCDLNNLVVFPIIHGTYGEDGCLQGLLEMQQIAYVGADPQASAVGIDKVLAKKLVESAGVKVVPYLNLRSDDWQSDPTYWLRKIGHELGFPIFVKPVSLGSSVGISKVKSLDELDRAIEDALLVDEHILIEKALNIREIEFAALGGYDPELTIAGEITATDGFYSYDEKYSNGSTTEVQVPANLEAEKISLGQDISRKVYKALHLYGFCRIDLFLSKDDGEYYFNEVNTIPGFTSISQYPMLWKHCGLEASLLIDKLIQLGMDRSKKRGKLQRTLS